MWDIHYLEGDYKGQTILSRRCSIRDSDEKDVFCFTHGGSGFQDTHLVQYDS